MAHPLNPTAPLMAYAYGVHYVEGFVSGGVYETEGSRRTSIAWGESIFDRAFDMGDAYSCAFHLADDEPMPTLWAQV